MLSSRNRGTRLRRVLASTAQCSLAHLEDPYLDSYQSSSSFSSAVVRTRDDAVSVVRPDPGISETVDTGLGCRLIVIDIASSVIPETEQTLNPAMIKSWDRSLRRNASCKISPQVRLATLTTPMRSLIQVYPLRLAVPSERGRNPKAPPPDHHRIVRRQQARHRWPQARTGPRPGSCRAR